MCWHAWCQWINNKRQFQLKWRLKWRRWQYFEWTLSTGDVAECSFGCFKVKQLFSPWALPPCRWKERPHSPRPAGCSNTPLSECSHGAPAVSTCTRGTQILDRSTAGPVNAAETAPHLRAQPSGCELPRSWDNWLTSWCPSSRAAGDTLLTAGTQDHRADTHSAAIHSITVKWILTCLQEHLILILYYCQQ